jgi:fumarylacetoacetase
MSGFGVFSTPTAPRRIGWRVGDAVLDLATGGLGDEFAEPVLNPFLARGRPAWEDAVGRILDHVAAGRGPLLPLSDVELHLPVAVADYVDFYSSLEHATNLGRLFRPDSEPLLPNWRWLPVA